MKHLITATQENGVLSFVHKKNWESRGVSVEKLIRETVNRFKIEKNFVLNVCTGDRPFGTYSFSTNTKSWGNAFPCFVFDGWPEVGVKNYEELISSFESREPLTNKIGWIGNTKMSPIRKVFVKSFSSKEYVEVLENFWNRKDPKNLFTNTNTYMSFQQQIDRWKYFIDIEGFGYSGRFKILLNSPRIVFLVDRPFEEFFYEHLEPWVTHVPVKRDFSDLEDNYKKIESDIKLQENILRNQKQFCEKHLTREAAYLQIKKIIESL